MLNHQILGAIIMLIVGIISYLISRKRNVKPTTVNIHNPKILLLQLGIQNLSLLEVDKAIYADFYSSITTKTVHTIQELREYISNSSFDLLHLLVDVDKEGNISDAMQDKIKIGILISLIQNGKAKYILFAKDIPSQGIHSGTEGLNIITNTVFTLDRKGDNFPNCFKRTFSLVSTGKTFPVAWNEITPQIPGADHDDSPSSFAAMGAENVVLLADK